MSFIKHISAGSVFLLLAACGMFSQTAAPIEAINTSGSNYGTSTASNNPYGAPPQNDAPYNPSQQSAYTQSNSGSYTASNAPIDVNATTHTVVYGDTIYNVAKRYGISQDDLRARNNLTDDTIKVGQVLNLRGSNTSTTNTAVANNKPTTSTPATTPVAQSSNTRQVAGITWSRPLQSSTVLSTFGGNSTGVVYGGSAGQPVYAAADGKVVYKGSALPSYGNLLIVQHNKKYLTVYGNNESILVSENQTVKRGQQIAKMGKTDAPRVQLHFEIREDGKPVNPTNYLP